MELDLDAERTKLERLLVDARQQAQAAATRVLLVSGALAEVNALVERRDRPAGEGEPA